MIANLQETVGSVRFSSGRFLIRLVQFGRFGFDTQFGQFQFGWFREVSSDSSLMTRHTTRSRMTLLRRAVQPA